MTQKVFHDIHLHTVFSNANMVEVISKPKDYIAVAKKQGRKAVCVTEHGTILSWVAKKKEVNDAGLKYVHGMEAYITDDLDTRVRDNYHLILIAKNLAGVHELNRLASNAYSGQGQANGDNHYYYSPRISFDELTQTSDNILITTACLGGPLWQLYKKDDKKGLKRWLDFIKENRHRVWLEVQPHAHPEQIAFNKVLARLSRELQVPLVASNDVHAHDEEANTVRKMLMRAKGIYFDDDYENTFELWCKDYNEMHTSFKEQGVLSEEEIVTALDQATNMLDLVEDFEFDTTIKYPKLFNSPDKLLREKVKHYWKESPLSKLPKEEQKPYQEAIKKEIRAFRNTKSVEYILLEEYVKSEMRKENIFPGPGRGSVTGSAVAFLLKITEVDPIKEGLVFERFINTERLNLPDVDSDWAKDDRRRVQEFLLTHPQLNCAAIVTYNTMALKGAMTEMGRALEMSPSLVKSLTKQVYEDENKNEVAPSEFYEEYPLLMEYAHKVIGVVTSVGRHAAGIIVTDRDVQAELGYIRLKNSEHPVSAIAMTEVDMLNYVKLDVLGLDNVQLLRDTCRLANIPRINPLCDYVDFNDEKVWRSMAENNVAIFQFDATDRAGKILKDIFSADTLDKIKQRISNLKFLDLLSIANAGQRPSGASYVEKITNGEFAENGHDSLNNFLIDTLGYLVYQEQQIKFLTDYCKRTPAGADQIRRAIGKKKKEVLENEVPKIREQFIDTMLERYGDKREHAEEIADKFMRIFLDAANYSFSKNHSVPYSYIGYMSAWLRYYYPLEFVTAGLEIWSGSSKGKKLKNKKLMNFAESKGIQISAPRFGYSKGSYFFDKETNTIYQGTAPIKDCKAEAGDLLYDLAKNHTNMQSFTELLFRIKDNSIVHMCDENGEEKTIPVLDLYKNKDETGIKAFDKELKKLNWKLEYHASPISRTKMLALIRLNFFQDFGNNKTLEEIYMAFDKAYKPKNKTFAGKFNHFSAVYKMEKDLLQDGGEAYTPVEQCEFELYYLGRVTAQSERIPAKYAFVTEIKNKGKTRTTAEVFVIKKGVSIEVKVGSSLYRSVPFEAGDILEINETATRPKKEKVKGRWVDASENEIWVKSMRLLRKSKFIKG